MILIASSISRADFPQNIDHSRSVNRERLRKSPFYPQWYQRSPTMSSTRSRQSENIFRSCAQNSDAFNQSRAFDIRLLPISSFPSPVFAFVGEGSEQIFERSPQFLRGPLKADRRSIFVKSLRPLEEIISPFFRKPAHVPLLSL